MVHFYIINPIQKLWQLARCWARGSKVAARRREALNALEEGQSLPRPPQQSLDVEKQIVQLRRDRDYYAGDHEGGFCVFVVQDTLFRVPRCYLLREPSAFSDMLSLPRASESQVAQSQDAMAIPLSDTVDQFRDFLWAIYAPPSQLGIYSSRSRDDVPIDRLLNVAELAIKYCVSSYEEWAIARIYQLANGGSSSFLRTASTSLCARTLNVCILSGHNPLRDLVEKHLVTRILWSPGDVETRYILEVAIHHNLRTIYGAVCYRELLDHLKEVYPDNTEQHATNDPKPNFSSIANINQQKSMELAYSSLATSMKEFSHNAPTLRDRLCPNHDQCTAAWTQLWVDANREAQQSAGEGLHAKVDILGRLKAIAINLKSTLPGERRMSVTCTLTALEAVVGLRDGIIGNLIQHFQAGDGRATYGTPQLSRTPTQFPVNSGLGVVL